MCEGVLQFSPDHESAKLAKHTIGQGKLNFVSDQRALDTLAELRLDDVTMLKPGEWAANLLIAKMTVPHKFGDVTHPAHALRNPGNGEKTDDYFSSYTGRYA
jgi:hypothetical protein